MQLLNTSAYAGYVQILIVAKRPPSVPCYIPLLIVHDFDLSCDFGALIVV